MKGGNKREIKIIRHKKSLDSAAMMRVMMRCEMCDDECYSPLTSRTVPSSATIFPSLGLDPQLSNVSRLVSPYPFSVCETAASFFCSAAVCPFGAAGVWLLLPAPLAWEAALRFLEVGAEVVELAPETEPGVGARLGSLVPFWEDEVVFSSGSGFLEDVLAERVGFPCSGAPDETEICLVDFLESSSRRSGYISNISTSRSLSSA